MAGCRFRLALPVLAVLTSWALWLCSGSIFAFSVSTKWCTSRPVGACCMDRLHASRPANCWVAEHSGSNFCRSSVSLDASLNTWVGTLPVGPGDCDSVVCYWMGARHTGFASIPPNYVADNHWCGRLHFCLVPASGKHPDVPRWIYL